MKNLIVRLMVVPLLFLPMLINPALVSAQSISAADLGGGSVQITATNDSGEPYEWKICHKQGRLNPIPASFCLNANNVDVVSSANPLITTVSGLETGKKGRWHTFFVKVHYWKDSGHNTKLWKPVGKAQIKVK